MENCTETEEGAFSWADQVRTGAFAWAGERLRKGPHKCPKVLSECQASADLRNVDQEGIYLAVYTIIHLKFCQKDVNTEGYELDT